MYLVQFHTELLNLFLEVSTTMQLKIMVKGPKLFIYLKSEYRRKMQN